jgi:hypothetical protein
MRGFRFLETRGGCGCARVYGFPIYFFFYARSNALSHIAEPPGGRSEAEEKREKNGTSGVHGGGYFAPHDTNNNFLDFGFDFYFGFLFMYSVLEHLRTAHRLPDGRFASRGALVELFLFIPRPHSF